MTSSASFSILLLLAQAPGGVSADSLGVNPFFEGRVVERIAAEWRTSPERVRIRWFGEPGIDASLTDAPFRLSGSGADGWLALRLDGAEPRRAPLRIRAGVVDTAYAAAVPIAAGSVLRRSDLLAEATICWGPPPGAGGSRPGPGWVARTNLAEGDRIAWPAAVAPPLIEAGESVRLEWERGAVRVVMEGTALNGARLGETVRVRVPGRPERLLGRVVAPGSAILADGGAR